MDEQQKATQFTGDEFLKVSEIAESFLKRGVSENPPKFVIFMGGVGAGKTTIRKQQFGKGYVHFEFGEIYTAVKKAFGENDPKLTSYSALACDLILRESFEKKKNIVTEIIGENYDLITPMIDWLKDAGYEISVTAITCDIVEAYKRHLQAVQENPDYLSAAHTQEATMSAFYHQLGLGDMPAS